jgi:hypothetical protein
MEMLLHSKGVIPMVKSNSQEFNQTPLPSEDGAKQLTLEDLKSLRGISREAGLHGSEDIKLLGVESAKTA